MAIHVVRQSIEIVTVNATDAVVHDPEIGVVVVVEVVVDLDRRDHGDDPEIVIVVKTRIRSVREKWNENMNGNVVGRDCTISKRII